MTSESFDYEQMQFRIAASANDYEHVIATVQARIGDRQEMKTAKRRLGRTLGSGVGTAARTAARNPLDKPDMSLDPDKDFVAGEGTVWEGPVEPKKPETPPLLARAARAVANAAAEAKKRRKGEAKKKGPKKRDRVAEALEAAADFVRPGATGSVRSRTRNTREDIVESVPRVPSATRSAVVRERVRRQNELDAMIEVEKLITARFSKNFVAYFPDGFDFGNEEHVAKVQLIADDMLSSDSKFIRKVGDELNNEIEAGTWLNQRKLNDINVREEMPLPPDAPKPLKKMVGKQMGGQDPLLTANPQKTPPRKLPKKQPSPEKPKRPLFAPPTGRERDKMPPPEGPPANVDVPPPPRADDNKPRRGLFEPRTPAPAVDRSPVPKPKSPKDSKKPSSRFVAALGKLDDDWNDLAGMYRVRVGGTETADVTPEFIAKQLDRIAEKLAKNEYLSNEDLAFYIKATDKIDNISRTRQEIIHFDLDPEGVMENADDLILGTKQHRTPKAILAVQLANLKLEFQSKVGKQANDVQTIVDELESITQRLNDDNFVGNAQFSMFFAMNRAVQQLDDILKNGTFDDENDSAMTDLIEKIDAVRGALYEARSAHSRYETRERERSLRFIEDGEKISNFENVEDAIDMRERISAELNELQQLFPNGREKDKQNLYDILQLTDNKIKELEEAAVDGKARLAADEELVGKSPVKQTGFRATAAGLLRRLTKKRDYKWASKRDKHGFHLPGAAKVEVGNKGIDSVDKAIKYLEETGDISEIPDEFLYEAIKTQLNWKTRERDGFRPGMGDLFQGFTRNENGVFEWVNPEDGGGVNGMMILVNKKTGQKIGVKFADGNHYGEHEDISELLGNHLWERLGFTQGGIRVAGPMQEFTNGGYAEYDSAPLVFDLVQNNFGDAVFQLGWDDPESWVKGMTTREMVTATVGDILIGNPDRHSGNFFLKRDDDGVVHFIPIDNGLGLQDIIADDPQQATEQWIEQSSDRNPMFAEIMRRVRSGDPKEREFAIDAIKEVQRQLRRAEADLPLDVAIDDIIDGLDGRDRPKAVQTLSDRIEWLTESTPEQILDVWLNARVF